jgi:hypothetical protein
VKLPPAHATCQGPGIEGCSADHMTRKFTIEALVVVLYACCLLLVV